MATLTAPDPALAPPPVPLEARDASVPRAAATPPRRRERLMSLDAFRGLTVAGMLLVNNPGTWGAIYEPLEHAPWHGWTPTDLIFPFFLFIVGITAHLSLSQRRASGDGDGALARQILRRGALIFLFGFALSIFPGFTWLPIAGLPDASFLDRVVHRWEHVRVMGVLQRIGVAYTIAALLSFRASLLRVAVTTVVLLYGYWAILAFVPTPGTGITGEIDVGALTLQGWLDRAILGVDHVWAGTRGTFDPEGILSSLGAVASVLCGVLAGRWIAEPRPLVDRVAGLFAAGAIAATAGLMWHWSLPINKNLWTPSYVLFMAGMAALSLATCMWLIEEMRVTRWARPFLVFGMNPIVAFVGSGLMARCLYSIFTGTWQGRTVPIQRVLYETGFHSWLAPKNASLLFAVAFVLLWFGLLSILHRKQWYLKI